VKKGVRDNSVVSVLLSPPRHDDQEKTQTIKRIVPTLQLSDCKNNVSNQTVKLFKSPKESD